MRRLALAAILVAFAAQTAIAFDPTPRRGNRVTVLQAPLYNGSGYEDRVASRVRQQLVRELRRRGFDAVDGSMSYEELRRGDRIDSNYYIELAPSDAYATTTGGASVGVSHAAVDLSVIVSRVAAELRIYDGRTLDLVTKRHLSRENVAVVPTGVGVGTYRMSVWFALPIAEYVRYRSAVNAVVADAAAEFTGVVQ